MWSVVHKSPNKNWKKPCLTCSFREAAGMHHIPQKRQLNNLFASLSEQTLGMALAVWDAMIKNYSS